MGPFQITTEDEPRASDPLIQPLVELVPVDKELPSVFEFGFGVFFFDAAPCSATPSSNSVWVDGFIADRKDLCETFFFASFRDRSADVDFTSDSDRLCDESAKCLAQACVASPGCEKQEKTTK